jgi:histidinol-phosphatase
LCARAVGFAKRVVRRGRLRGVDLDLAFALELADRADAITLARFRAPDLRVETKPDDTPVSDADRATEAALRAAIAASRPGDTVVGEEFGADPTAAGDRWILDPIDGTKSYVRGIPVWATLIALHRDGAPRAAVASAPALGRRWWAVRGEGSFADGDPIHVSKVDRLEDAMVCFGGLKAWREAGRLEGLLDLVGRAGRGRGYGDFWMHLLVAEGSADVATEPDVDLWDLAAVQLIVEEAGGRFTDLSGRATPEGGSALSTNGLLHEEALRAVGPRR